MTKEPYVVKKLLFTVLSYDITVHIEGMIAWVWFITATWWRWVEALWVGPGGWIYKLQSGSMSLNCLNQTINKDFIDTFDDMLVRNV